MCLFLNLMNSVSLLGVKILIPGGIRVQHIRLNMLEIQA